MCNNARLNIDAEIESTIVSPFPFEWLINYTAEGMVNMIIKSKYDIIILVQWYYILWTKIGLEGENDEHISNLTVCKIVLYLMRFFVDRITFRTSTRSLFKIFNNYRFQCFDWLLSCHRFLMIPHWFRYGANSMVLLLTVVDYSVKNYFLRSPSIAAKGPYFLRRANNDFCKIK
jgi:hypothetical protein